MRAEEWANLSARAAIGVHLPGSGPGTYSGFCMGGHVFHKRRNQTPHHIVPLRVFFHANKHQQKFVFLFFKTRELQQVGARDRKEINMDITAPKKRETIMPRLVGRTGKKRG